MLQTRAGRCWKCKETIVPGVELCPVCGTRQNWMSSDAKYQQQQTTSSTQSTSPVAGATFTRNDIIRWLAYLSVACLLIFLALALRSWVLSDAPTEGTAGSHGLRVRDAEVFREQVFSMRTDPGSPENRYILGVAMPADSELLQITVRNEWLLLEAGERLEYAKRYASRWQKIHAPHRSYLSLFDASGEEIGGRTWTGKVWVKEDHGAVQRQTSAQDSGRKPQSNTR